MLLYGDYEVELGQGLKHFFHLGWRGKRVDECLAQIGVPGLHCV
jgi:hypothetical protein